MRLTTMLRAAVRLTLPPPLSIVLPAACRMSCPADRWIAPPPLAPSQPRPAPATRSALSNRSLVASDAVRLMPPLPARMPTPWSSAGLLSTVMLPLAVTDTAPASLVVSPVVRSPLIAMSHRSARKPISLTRPTRRSVTAPMCSAPALSRRMSPTAVWAARLATAVRRRVASLPPPMPVPAAMRSWSP